MLLKRQEKDNKIKAIYKSSTICASILENDTKDLTIIFNNGGQYKYPKVSDADYMRFELADSQGSVLNSHIKKYPYTKLDPVNVTAILKEIEELSVADASASLDEKTKAMLQSMIGLVSFYVDKGTVRQALLTKVEFDIAAYNKVVASLPVAPQVIS